MGVSALGSKARKYVDVGELDKPGGSWSEGCTTLLRWTWASVTDYLRACGGAGVVDIRHCGLCSLGVLDGM